MPYRLSAYRVIDVYIHGKLLGGVGRFQRNNIRR